MTKGFVEIDRDAVRNLPAEHVTEVIDYVDEQVKVARGYVNIARATGITQNILGGNFLSYESIQEIVQCLAGRTSLTEPQRARLGDLEKFWKSEEKLLRDGFYGGKHLEGVKTP